MAGNGRIPRKSGRSRGSRATVTVTMTPAPDADPECIQKTYDLWDRMIIEKWFEDKKNSPVN